MRSFAPVLPVWQHLLVLILSSTVSASSIAHTKNPHCAADLDSVKLLVNDFASPHPFCEFWEIGGKKRTNSPLDSLDAAQVSQGCDCILATPTLAGAGAAITMGPRPTGNVRQCWSKDPVVQYVAEEVHSPKQFCHYWMAGHHHEHSPFQSVDAAQISSVCSCAAATSTIFSSKPSTTEMATIIHSGVFSTSVPPISRPNKSQIESLSSLATISTAKQSVKASTTATLSMVVPTGIDRSSPDILKPANTVTLYYANPGSGGGKDSTVDVNAGFGHPVVNLDHSSLIASVKCSSGGAEIAFADSQTATLAMAAWNGSLPIVLIATMPDCSSKPSRLTKRDTQSTTTAALVVSSVQAGSTTVQVSAQQQSVQNLINSGGVVINPGALTASFNVNLGSTLSSAVQSSSWGRQPKFWSYYQTTVPSNSGNWDVQAADWQITMAQGFRQYGAFLTPMTPGYLYNELYCVGCSVSGQIGVTGSIAPGTSSLASRTKLTLDGYLGATVNIGYAALNPGWVTAGVNLLRMPLQAFVIPGVATITPTVALDFSMTITSGPLDIGQLYFGSSHNMTMTGTQLLGDGSIVPGGIQSTISASQGAWANYANDEDGPTTINMPLTLELDVTMMGVSGSMSLVRDPQYMPKGGPDDGQCNGGYFLTGTMTDQVTLNAMSNAVVQASRGSYVLKDTCEQNVVSGYKSPPVLSSALPLCQSSPVTSLIADPTGTAFCSTFLGTPVGVASTVSATSTITSYATITASTVLQTTSVITSTATSIATAYSTVEICGTSSSVKQRIKRQPLPTAEPAAPRPVIDNAAPTPTYLQGQSPAYISSACNCFPGVITSVSYASATATVTSTSTITSISYSTTSTTTTTTTTSLATGPAVPASTSTVNGQTFNIFSSATLLNAGTQYLVSCPCTGANSGTCRYGGTAATCRGFSDCVLFCSEVPSCGGVALIAGYCNVLNFNPLVSTNSCAAVSSGNADMVAGRGK
ncbi:hypothetical protein ANO11243_091990 [Dothideomycetidae sp. 11243]|nr:hypothetical protein ANO11243_091990 [fungal sp. No.11243]